MKIRTFGLKSDKKITKSNKNAESHLISNHQIPKISKVSWDDAYKIVFAAKLSEFFDLDFINIKRDVFDEKFKKFLNEKQATLNSMGHGDNDNVMIQVKADLRNAIDVYKILNKENNFNKIQKACSKNKVFNLDFLIKNLPFYKKYLTDEPRVTKENKIINLVSLIRLDQNGLVGHIKTLSDLKKTAETRYKKDLGLVMGTINQFEKKFYPEDQRIEPKHGEKEKLIPTTTFDEEIRNLFS